MSASFARNEGRGLDLKDALALLEQALEILDANEASLDVGARLFEVIEKLKAPDDA